jgi:hypothetical protein
VRSRTVSSQLLARRPAPQMRSLSDV